MRALAAPPGETVTVAPGMAAVHFYGTHSVDVDGELAKLDSDGYRPLRVLGTPAGG